MNSSNAMFSSEEKKTQRKMYIENLANSENILYKVVKSSREASRKMQAKRISSHNEYLSSLRYFRKNATL